MPLNETVCVKAYTATSSKDAECGDDEDGDEFPVWFEEGKGENKKLLGARSGLGALLFVNIHHGELAVMFRELATEGDGVSAVPFSRLSIELLGVDTLAIVSFEWGAIEGDGVLDILFSRLLAEPLMSEDDGEKPSVAREDEGV